jgi:hypothetical protein
MEGFFKPKKNHLDTEKEDFIKVMCALIDNVDLEEPQLFGRPRADVRDILKSLLIMSYHCFSYRRAKSDINELKEKGLILNTFSISTLNNYMLDPKFQATLKTLIELCALSFVDVEDCVILDSTWFCNMLRLSHSRYNKNKVSVPNLVKTRKLHTIICKKSKIIISAETSLGTVHDSNYFIPLLEKAIKLGFRIKTLIADAGYTGKDNHALCQDYGITAFIDFRKNERIGRDKSNLRRKQLTLFLRHKEMWHEVYDYRAIIETVYSAMKRKGKNYIRSRKAEAQDSEMLLRVLWYDLTIIAKHFF